jgi:hypothetical protein
MSVTRPDVHALGCAATGSSYPPITVTVAGDAPPSVTNAAAIAGTEIITTNNTGDRSHDDPEGSARRRGHRCLNFADRDHMDRRRRRHKLPRPPQF